MIHATFNPVITTTISSQTGHARVCVRWQDIVVGAPQYFEKEGEIGGAVYVYINKGGKWNEVKPERIDGPQDSMFGLAVENLGDINQDGYHGEAAAFVRVHMYTHDNRSFVIPLLE